MRSNRGNVQSLGWLVFQHQDSVDVFGDSFDYSNRAINYGARYEWTTDSDGFPIFDQVAGTQGPLGGFFVWPGKSPRLMGQWGVAIPAKITTASPLKATPVEFAAAGVPTLSTDLDELAVSTLDGSSPAVGTFGLVVVGTELDDQNPIFFAGGGGSSTAQLYQVDMNHGGGTYDLKAIDHPGGTYGATILSCKELASAPAVPVGAYVWGWTLNDGVTYFDKPLGC